MMMDSRQSLLQKWLTHHLKTFSLHPMIGDASFRRYFRVTQGDQSWVAMDAPPDRESCLTFVAISKALRVMGLLVPEIIEANLAEGFLLITDFGDRQLLQDLTPANAEIRYSAALDALAILQSCPWEAPVFTDSFMLQELAFFKQWFLQGYLELSLSPSEESVLTKGFENMVKIADTQPKVFMHRDYHSANLMVLPNNQIGILDFQDAFKGPITYDLVSLLRDCYIDWPDSLVKRLALRYKEQLHLSMSDDEFLYGFDMMGLQRHLKALLTFSRKYKRDQVSSYLKHIPRTLNYILKISDRYEEFRDFHLFLQDKVMLCVE